MKEHDGFIRFVSLSVIAVGVMLLLILCECLILLAPAEIYLPAMDGNPEPIQVKQRAHDTYWIAPDSLAVPVGPDGDLIRYGRELIARTSVYLGPNGTIAQTTNGMNCQNCHLKSGTKLFGNNYSAVYSTYPQVRSRSGTLVTIEERINGCLERSLNGGRLEDDSREMIAMKAYFKWVGQNVPPGVRPKGAGIWDLPFLERAADPVKGKLVYETICQRCHGQSGGGKRIADSKEWLYPPLWGDSSYNTGAGLYRLSRFAGYVKMNMPYEVTFDNPELTDEQAWDVTAYVNSMPRPQKSFPNDWPDISRKPFDHPFGPYSDSYSEEQHKYGPYQKIKEASLAKK
jgi:thiosulfate dehydrogenase